MNMFLYHHVIFERFNHELLHMGRYSLGMSCIIHPIILC